MCREIESACKDIERECVCVCVFRERERERESVQREREREREIDRWKVCAERGKECVLK